jgi:diguanylate cyclase (GGDEF)-like protein
MTRSLNEWMKSRNSRGIFLTGIFFCMTLGWLGMIVGDEFSFSIFYLAPVSMVAWYCGRGRSIVISFFASLTWLAVDLLGGKSYSVQIVPYLNALGRMIIFLVVSFLITSLKSRLEYETKLAYEDFLTKISNNRAFFNYAEMEMSRLRRYGDPFTIAYFDIDNFKKINDMYGHITGNKLLENLAYTVRRHIRPTDVVARIGGDEFVVLFIETGEDEAKTVMEKLYSVMLAKMKEHDWPVTFSFGVVTFKSPPASVDELLKVADTLMYQVKQRGKNAIKFSVYGSGTGVKNGSGEEK